MIRLQKYRVVKLLDYRLFIFDLDNTIYDENNYLRKAYNYIAEMIFKKNSSLSVRQMSSFLISEFENNGRFNLYQKLLDKYDIGNFPLKEFLYCLRNVPIDCNSIPIDKKVQELITILINHKKMVSVLTNGNPDQQKNKINSIDFPHKNEIKIYYASSKGSEFEKPSPYFIDKIKYDSCVEKNEILFIGDSKIDSDTAKNSCIDFMNINQIEQL